MPAVMVKAADLDAAAADDRWRGLGRPVIRHPFIGLWGKRPPPISARV